jgi:uncharacterized membrane protein YbhN (UPF0104 family)
MKLSAWVRLWLVFSVVGFLFCGTFAYFMLPSANNIPHKDDYYKYIDQKYQGKIIKEGTSEKKSELIEEAERRNLITRVQMPNNHIILFRNDLTKEEMEKASGEYWRGIEKQAREKSIKTIIYAFIGWLILVTTVYLLGWSAGWIYRGFKHK